MKKILISLLGLSVLFAYGAINPISSPQIGTGASNGYVLQTNGATSTWVSTSTLGFSGGGITNAYASNTFPSFLYGSSTYYFASNPDGYITSAALSPYMTYAYATDTYATIASLSNYYLASNPSGYITNSVSDLTNYPTYTYATNTYYFASNPSGYITSASLSPYALLASPTFTGTTTHTNIKLSGFLRDSVNATGTSGQVLISTGTSTLWQTLAGGGITSLAGLTASSQTFATSSDTNIGLTIVSSGSSHTFTSSWIGTLADGRIASSASWNAAAASTTALTPAYIKGLFSATYPIIYSNGVISTGFSTTTNNTYTGTASLATTTLRSALNDSTGSQGSSGQVLSSTGTSTLWIASVGGGEVTYTYASSTYARQNQTVFNQSYGSQGAGFSTDTYIGGSTTTIPQNGLQKGSRYYLVFYARKTAAGTAIATTSIRFGTNGSTADTAICTLVTRPQTGAIDFAVFEVWVTFNSVGSGSSAVIACTQRVTHQLSITGFGNLVSMATTTTSAGFDSTVANSKIGVSINGGTSASWTISTVQAKLENLP